jgi:uncharacterized protein involved in exopolysaccharide biosynthesis
VDSWRFALGKFRVRYSLRSLLGAVVIIAVACGAVRAILPKWKYRGHVLLRVQFGVARIGYFTVEQDAVYESAFRRNREETVRMLKSEKVLDAALTKLGVDSLHMLHTASDPVSWLRDALDVVPRDNSDLLEISLCGDDASEIQCVLKGVIDAYLEVAGTAKPPHLVFVYPVTVTSWQLYMGL